ncbi:acyl carrier protein [Buchnera aphidicola (Nipponaphis monzeni)]|uniref:Acyl carrier protein n=1 Tax=Buchnera aphidicola (Nipponaphis monzeni) TaxID=2495405 RepID=A0A455TAG3_9GAMM|nr:acyl carrier protein [Buchnera aphidicola]BBI01280.1 acyl carrier protein [Buchnera aphidicola (Nipponaphis monzeni)]
MNNVEKKIKLIISKQLGINKNKILNSFYFSEDLGVDSLDLIELIMAIEKKFNIEIPDEIIEKINSVGKIIKYVCKLTLKK